MSQYEKCALLIAVLGWPVSSYCAYRLGIRAQKRTSKEAAANEARNRNRSFLSFLAAQKQEIGSERYRAQPALFRQRYSEIQIEFRRHEAWIEADIPQPARLRFKQLIDAIVGLPDATAATHDGIKHILQIIGETETFIHAAS